MSGDSIQLLAINVLQPNPFQPRNKIMPDELADLTKSIQRHGILEPLIVAQTPAGYQIIAGERRWRASQQAGLEEVPVILKKTTTKGMLEMALIENVQRVNLSPIERAQAFQQLERDFGYSISEVADSIGKSTSYISNSLKLLSLPDAIKDGLLGKLITEGHAKAMMGIEDTSTMIEVYKKVLKKNASVRKTEQFVRDAKSAIHQIKYHSVTPRTAKKDSAEVKKWEENLKKIIGEQSKIKLRRTLRQTTITITLRGNLNETQDALETIMSLQPEK